MNRTPLFLLLLACFLAPMIGGQVYIGTQPFDGNLRGPCLPFLAHAVLALLAFGAFALSIFQRKVVPLPNPTMTIGLVAVLASFGMTLTISSFKWLSWGHWLEWLAYGFALLAVVATAGRERGPRAILWALTVGSSACAVEGIGEYAVNRASDPSWRIFASWVNPNALAGMLLIGFILALGLIVSEDDRLAKIAAGGCSVVLGFALLLTQSKGGFLAALVGLAVLVIMQWIVGSKRKLLVLAVPLVVMGLLVTALRTGPSNLTGLSRVEASAGTAEQSAGFRQLLWRGAIKMAQENPFGYGLGTYRFESARSGLTPQTQFTHQGYLQIAVEAGLVGLIAWLAFAVGWFWTVMRGIRRTAPDRAVRLASVIAAVVACGCHNLMDSDWQHFGIGFVFFILLGVGVQLAADGSLPELLPKPARATAVLLPIVAGLALLHVGAAEFVKANAQAMIEARDPNAPREAQLARALAAGDGEVYRLLAFASPESAKVNLQTAAELAPSTKNLRTLAQFLVMQGDGLGAKRALQNALHRDPNNLPTLLMLVQIADAEGNRHDLEKWMTRLDEVRKTPYYTVRALPQVIPTEVALASFIAAKHFPEQRESRVLDGLKIMVEYAKVTVPLIQMHVRGGGSDYAGETPSEATQKIGEARDEAENLLRLYRAEDRDATELEGIIADLAVPDFGPRK